MIIYMLDIFLMSMLQLAFDNYDIEAYTGRNYFLGICTFNRSFCHRVHAAGYLNFILDNLLVCIYT